MKYPLLSAFCILLFFLNAGVSCNKNIPNHPKEEVLPPETQSGERTLGCLINGEVWTAKGGGFSPRLTAEYVFDQKWLLINAHRSFRIPEEDKEIEESMRIRIKGVKGEGIYQLDFPDSSYVDYANLITDCYYTTDSILTGRVELTKFDLVERVAAGRFSFEVKREGCPDIIATEGRFDVPF